jgi:hypothetical protein
MMRVALLAFGLCIAVPLVIGEWRGLFGRRR